MGYCGPVWISDYHDALLYDRLIAVTASSSTSLKRAMTPLALWATLVRVSQLPGGILYAPELASPPARIRMPGYETATYRP